MRVIRPAQLALFGALVLSSVAAAPPAAPALPPTPVVGPDSSASAGRETPEDLARRAMALHEQATEAGAAGRWKKASALHQRAASLHAATDGRGSRCLELSANLLFNGGDLAGARRALEGAAELALARGDVAVGADALLKAGLVARDQGDGAASVALTRRAQMLANSRHLSEAERSEILARILPR
jgi:hypothetical protein